MRIVHCLRRVKLEDGGVVRCVLDLAGALADAGHEVTLFTADASDVPHEWRKSSTDTVCPRVVELPLDAGPSGTLVADTASRAREAFTNADIVHLHTAWYSSNPPLARLATQTDTPYVVSIHGMLDDWSMAQRHLKKRLYLVLRGRAMLERAAFVHCTAEAEKDQSQRWYPKGTPRVVPLIMDLAPFEHLPGPHLARETFPDAFASGTEAPTILFLSRLHEKKGLHILIPAVAALHAANVPATLLIAGTGEPAYERRCRALVERHNLADHCHVLGLVTGETKLSVYQAADLLALPTAQENFGFVCPESLACTTPVITTKGVDIWPELERSGGALIAGGTSDAFAKAIAELASDPERRAAMGEHGRDWVFANFAKDVVLSRFESMYHDAIGARP
ncbi:MAG: glycosyltransferase [Planctomycetota bacterium]